MRTILLLSLLGLSAACSPVKCYDTQNELVYSCESGEVADGVIICYAEGKTSRLPLFNFYRCDVG